jgi:cytoskeleton protein RodZ
MDSIGTYLKSAREAKKISLEEISRATKIRRVILEAIERDQGEVLLPEVVVKGYIEAYARHVGLDPKEVLSKYTAIKKGSEGADSGESLPDRKRNIPAKYFFVGGVCLLIIIIIPFLFFSERGIEEGAHETALATPPTEQIDMVPSEDLQSFPSLLSVEETMPLQTPPVGVEEAQKVQEVQEIETVEEIVAVQEEEPPLVHEHTLVITASERTWIQIQEGSSLPFDVMLYPGDSFTRTSSQQLVVVIGNAGGVTVSFDGKKLESLGKDGEVVRLSLPSPAEG